LNQRRQAEGAFWLWPLCPNNTLEKVHNTALMPNEVSAWGVAWRHPFRSSRFSQHFGKTFAAFSMPRVVALRFWPLRHFNTVANQQRVASLDITERRQHPDAMFDMGTSYYFGTNGASQDTAVGKRFLRQAAEAGHARAQCMLGRIAYDEMEALRKLSQAHDYQAAAEAERWLTRASAQGELGATRTLISLCVAKGDLFSACQNAGLWLRGVLGF
jgi:TPR repeat protein